jgi:DNA-cytosine methyltransferase
MRVLSLFDGMACGLTALKRAGVEVSEYHAFEMDKYAIQIAKKNHPEIIHHGKITEETDFTQFKGFDLVMGGSPCQGFSFAGKQLAFDDPRSKLFFEFVRAVKETKCKHFLLENVRMKKEYLDVISEQLGVEPVCINSALVSAQNRVRYYWCNWKVEQPEDKGILLKDILEDGVVDRDKSYCIDANYWKGGNLKAYFEKSRRQLVFEAKNKKEVHIFQKDIDSPRTFYETRTEEGKRIRREIKQLTGKDSTPRGPEHKKYVCQPHQKANCIVTVDSFLNYVIDKDYVVRKLTPIECERLQTLREDNYTEGVSNTQRYKMLGNGWTVDVITHILGGLPQ